VWFTATSYCWTRGGDSGPWEATIPGHVRPRFRAMGSQCGGRLRVGHPRGFLSARFTHGSVEFIYATVKHGTVEKIGVKKGWSAERWRE